MSYLDKQINNILIKESISGSVFSRIVSAIDNNAALAAAFKAVLGGLQNYMIRYAPIGSFIFHKDKEHLFEVLKALSGWNDLKTIGIFDPAKLDAIYGKGVLLGLGPSFDDIYKLAGFKAVQAWYLYTVGMLGVDTSEKIYNALSQNKELVQKSTEMVDAVKSGDTETVVDIASSVKPDDSVGMITPSSLDNSAVVENLEKSDSIFSRAREIALEYPKLYVPIMLLTIVGFVYLKLRNKNKL